MSRRPTPSGKKVKTRVNQPPRAADFTTDFPRLSQPTTATPTMSYAQMTVQRPEPVWPRAPTQSSSSSAPTSSSSVPTSPSSVPTSPSSSLPLSLPSTSNQSFDEYEQPAVPITYRNQFERKGARGHLTAAAIPRIASIVEAPILIDNTMRIYKKKLESYYNFTFFGGPLPSIETTRKEILKMISVGLRHIGIEHHVYLFGGAAAFVTNGRREFSDVDILIDMDISADRRHFAFREIQSIMARTLQSFLSPGLQGSYMEDMIDNSYYSNKLLICGDGGLPSWSLFSLNSNHGIKTDIKFNATIQRSWQFYSDSIWYRLDKFLEDVAEEEIRREFEVFTTSGRIQLAIHLLHTDQVLTDDPNLIYGGGLLKYACYRQKGMIDAEIIPEGLLPMKKLYRRMIFKFYGDFGDRKKMVDTVFNFVNGHFDAVPSKVECLDFLSDFVLDNVREVQIAEEIIDRLCKVKEKLIGRH